MSKSRRMRRLFALTTLAVLLPLNARADATRTEHATYYGGTFATAVVGCEFELGDDPNIGGACFAIDEFETSADLTISDLSGRPVGGDWYTFDAAGNLVDLEIFCGSAKATIAPSATRLIVATDYLSSAAACFVSTGAPTTGTITATFYKPDNAG